jgi:gluconate 2-dehydrogenase gamma chain
MMDRREAIRRTALVMGGLVSAPAILGVLNGCTAEPGLQWLPRFLTKDEAKMVEQMAGIIIPETDTPGARQVGVPQFIDRMINDVYSDVNKEKFKNDLAKFEEDVKSEFGKIFLKLKPEQQEAHIKKINEVAVNARADHYFFMTVKELTVLGFFTSQVGATQVLQHKSVPGEQRGCVPLSEVGKTWSM